MATINYKDPVSGQWVEIPTGGTDITVDSSLSSTSENPVQNKVINSALSGKVSTTTTVNGHSLSSNVTVTKSDVGLGNVDNTSDKAKPISTATQTALDGKQAAITSSNKLSASLVDGLSTVATSGSYSDLSNKPTIPAPANNGMLDIQKNGTTVATFGANEATLITANIEVPTKVSELTNDAGYTTNTGTVTSVKTNGTIKNPASGVVDLGGVVTNIRIGSEIPLALNAGVVTLPYSKKSETEAQYGVVKIWLDTTDNYLHIRTDGQ